jgi:hypothetical protein
MFICVTGGLGYSVNSTDGHFGQLAFNIKGVGRGPTLAWPGWKQSVIAVEVDTGQLETSRFKKCYANCVLLYFPSTEIKSAFNVY